MDENSPNDPPLYRTREHRDRLHEAFDIAELWDEFGIVAEVIVIGFDCSSRYVLNSRQPFTDGFPRAIIYELLSCDLLHQIIKGGFKDHLVDWTVQYITRRGTYGKKVLADIDNR